MPVGRHPLSADQRLCAERHCARVCGGFVRAGPVLGPVLDPCWAKRMAQGEAGGLSSRRLLTTQNEASPTAAPQIASMNEAM